MSEHESSLPLLVGLVVAMLVHLFGASLLAQWLVREALAGPDRLLNQKFEPLVPEPRPIPLGRDSPKPSAVAWISYQDFRQLMAPKSKTEQPALQQQVDPTPNAPLPQDPTPPLPTQVVALEEASPSPSMDVPNPLDGPVGQPIEMIDPVHTLPEAPQNPLEVTDLIMGGKTTRFRPVTTPKGASGSKANRRAVDRSDMAQPSRHKANPTAAPRSDRESSPVRIKDHAKTIVPGGVLVGDGIEIKTVAPRFTMVTRVSAAPSNPVVRLVFNHRDGRVTKAMLTRSSGYPNVDGPILASLYRWRAQGQRLSQMNRPFEIQIKLILVD